MATFRLPHFAAVGVLGAITPDRLLKFLGPYREFFRSRGVTLPPLRSRDRIPYADLIGVFLAPDHTTPGDLIDALYHVDALATPEGMNLLLAAAREAGLPVRGTRLSSADVAVQVWLADRGLVERLHAEQHLTTPRSFEYFQSASSEPPAFRTPDAGTRADLTSELNEWFAEHRRGRTARVFIFERTDCVEFLIRHGDAFKREESFVGTEPSSVAYRPLRYDVVVFDRSLGELRIHAALKGEKDLYCRALGRHVFGDAELFPSGTKYTLEPLRDSGDRSLICTDVDGC